MTEQLDPSSVLAYLNEMGYYNISTYQLKEFLKDLKKLMKHEEKLNFQTEINNHTRLVLEKSDKLYSTQTVSSKAKTTQKCPEVSKENTRSKDNYKAEKTNEFKNSVVTEKKCIPLKVKSSDNKITCLTDMSHLKKVVRECQSIPTKSITSKKSNTQTSAKNTNTRLETDPVTLYHQYKKEWERKRIPGENSHSQLRWKVRQKICQL